MRFLIVSEKAESKKKKKNNNSFIKKSYGFLNCNDMLNFERQIGNKTLKVDSSYDRSEVMPYDLNTS